MPKDDEGKNAVKEVKDEVKDAGKSVPGEEDPEAKVDAGERLSKGEDKAVKEDSKNEEAKADLPEADEFGLPIRPPRRRTYDEDDDEFQDASERTGDEPKEEPQEQTTTTSVGPSKGANIESSEPVASKSDQTLSEKPKEQPSASTSEAKVNSADKEVAGKDDAAAVKEGGESAKAKAEKKRAYENPSAIPIAGGARIGERQMSERQLRPKVEKKPSDVKNNESKDGGKREAAAGRSPSPNTQSPAPTSNVIRIGPAPGSEKEAEAPAHASQKSVGGGVSEWSHQQLATKNDEEDNKPSEGEWQSMPSLATFRQYDDWGKVTAQAYDEVDDETVEYGRMGGAAKGYTRVQLDEDAESATSFDDNTAYLFKEGYARNALDEEDEARDLISQMQTTKELLTEGQRIAYVGLVRLAIAAIVRDMEALERTKGSKKAVDIANEAVQMWGQKMMVRLYTHMEISAQEQVMVEQLAEHGLQAGDLTPPLMQNARVKNPEAKVEEEASSQASSARPSVSSPRIGSNAEKGKTASTTSLPSSRPASRAAKTSSSSKPSTPAASGSRPQTPAAPGTPASEAPPPAYEQHTADDLHVENPDDYADNKSLDLDIRWTVLCDLFLLLIADSTYDARSRVLLERVGSALSVEWQEVCRFEKRVTDALEMQEQADKENWNEDEHMAARQKAMKNRRLMVMGLCTVGGGLVIGLSAGLLAPVIGAGLAAGFTSIGVAGTSSFFAGTGAAALIGTTGALTGANIGVKASNRRTGAVKTFEYRPLHNNKRVNLIVTVAGWMTGNVDDVRLPFSTVDPVMGDIYSVHWEPEMLRSTGQTIQILGTEALTQTIQQVLGATMLATLMAGLSMPLMLAKLSYLIDNPWTVSLARADAAGLILADSLIDRNLGVRPITLVGFSLGARVIFAALRELASRGALGLIQNVYLFGSPIVVKKDEWLRARSVVSGRMVNGYATNDWILGYLFRATSGGVMRVAGLSEVPITNVENINVTDKVPGHMAYRAKMPILLRQVGFEVESDEFTEIEDPDPENHDKRQRELINEIEEARRQLEEEPKKKGFLARFTRRKAQTKKSWETYDENSKNLDLAAQKDPEKLATDHADLMFDVDAIRREALALAQQNPGDIEEIKKHLSVREIESTLPPMRIASSSASPSHAPQASINGSAGPSSKAATPQLRQTQSFNGHDASPETSPTNGHIKSPTYPPAKSSEEEEGVTRSFDSPPVKSPTSPRSDLDGWASERPRPPLRSSTTTPAIQQGSNPWAEESDVRMSFE